MTLDKNKACRDCRWYDTWNGHEPGQCKRHAPAPGNPSPSYTCYSPAEFPKVNGWRGRCGDWELKEATNGAD